MRADLRPQHEPQQPRQHQRLDQLLGPHPRRVRRELHEQQPDDPERAEQDHPPVRPAAAAEQRPHQEHVDDAEHDVADHPAPDAGRVAAAQDVALGRVGDVPVVQLVCDDAVPGDQHGDRQQHGQPEVGQQQGDDRTQLARSGRSGGRRRRWGRRGSGRELSEHGSILRLPADRAVGGPATIVAVTDLDAEDAKIVTLARAARGRIGAAEGAAVRDTDGRTYVGTTVALPSLALSALQVAVAAAVASGATGLEAAALVTDGRRRPTSPAAPPSPTSPPPLR